MAGPEGPLRVPGPGWEPSRRACFPLQLAPVGWAVIWFCSPVEFFHNFLFVLVEPYKITDNLTFDLEDSSFL